MDQEYILYCDESEKKGSFYSNFYGGVMVGSSHFEEVVLFLNEEKMRLNLLGEIKWAKVSEAYLEKYKEFMKAFFLGIRSGHLKVRIMFRQNAYEPNNLTTEDHKNSYFKLYYQFIKHAYGLENAKLSQKVKLRLYFDSFPENREAAFRFKGFLLALNKNVKIQRAGIVLKEEDISEVHSHDHILLQSLDIVLGAIHFRLNDKHQEKLVGSRFRGKRTIAKEKLYKTILDEIKTLKIEFKNFNIGNSTFISDLTQRWYEPYLHWNFKPKDGVFKGALTKNGNKKTPIDLHNTSDA